MIVEIEITVPIKYLKEAENNLDKIKLPFTNNMEKDVTNKTALILAQSNLRAVRVNLEKDMDKKQQENEEMEQTFRKEKV